MSLSLRAAGLSVITALILCSSFFPAFSQEGTPAATPTPSVTGAQEKGSLESLSGKDLMAKAKEAENNSNYSDAMDLYGKAATAFQNSGDEKGKIEAYKAAHLDEFILYFYCIEENKLARGLGFDVGEFNRSEFDDWKKQGLMDDSMTVNGKVLYGMNVAPNLMLRSASIRERSRTYDRRVTKLIDTRLKIVDALLESKTAEKYSNPKKFLVKISSTFGRIPKGTKIKEWIPIPVDYPSQKDIKVTAPKDGFTYQSGPNAGAGYAYLETTSNSDKDFTVVSEYKYTSSEIHMENIDPAKVGEYNKNSEEYKKFVPFGFGVYEGQKELRWQAEAILRHETNPYLIAKGIYEWVVDNSQYSLIPTPLIKDEAQYAFEHKYGDGTALSALFCSMCRMRGIPARIIGGDDVAGDDPLPHVWGEFFLQGYGWVPVDPARERLLIDCAPKDGKDKYKFCYFARMDAYRMVSFTEAETPLKNQEYTGLINEIYLQAPMIEWDGITFFKGLGGMVVRL